MKSRDTKRAIELSESKFVQFENISRYMLGLHSEYDLSIFNFKPWELLHSISLSSSTASKTSSPKGTHKKFLLTENFFLNPLNGNKWIWDRLKSERMSDLERRIFAAINWIGKSAKESDSANSFIQCIFALESLFTFQEKGVLVSPSIANQLAEYSAFILGKSFQSRTQYLKLVKELYSKRSKVAHGGSQSILSNELSEAYKLVNDLIVTLITHPKLKNLQSFGQLQNWVDIKKYS